MSVIKTGFKFPLLDLKEINIKHINEFTSFFKEYIESGIYILGKNVEEFENKMAKYINKNYCIGVGNGTNALEIAFQSLNLSSNDEVLLQSNTYIVTSFAIKRINPIIIPVDITNQGIIDIEDIKRKITNKTKLIIVVHLYGDCCNMEELSNLCKEKNILLVEDCAQAQGTKYNNKKIGSFGDISCFSFYPSKNLGAIGDGGAICTDREDLYIKMKKIRNIGSIVKYIHDELGTNSRLNPCTAKILSYKLDYLDEDIMKKRELVCEYEKLLDKNKYELVYNRDKDVFHSYHLCVIRYKCDSKFTYRERLIEYCNNNGVEILVHYPNLFYKNHIFKELNNYELYCEKFIENIFSIPLYHTLSKENVEEICTILNNFTPFYISNADP